MDENYTFLILTCMLGLETLSKRATSFDFFSFSMYSTAGWSTRPIYLQFSVLMVMYRLHNHKMFRLPFHRTNYEWFELVTLMLFKDEALFYENGTYISSPVSKKFQIRFKQLWWCSVSSLFSFNYFIAQTLDIPDIFG